MKIVFFEVHDWEKRLFKNKLKKFQTEFYNEPLTENNYQNAKNADVISTFIYSKITPKLLKNLKKLKLIATRSTGYDHISITQCKKQKIKVCNRPAYGENTVAEHTFALILSLARKLYLSRDKILKDDFTISGLKGFDLEGKTIGVVGVGNIGKHVIRIARGFNMKVLAYDHQVDEFLAEQLNFRYVPFKELLKKSDVITLHIPHTNKTHHLINKKTFSQFKRGSVLINTARGGIVDNKSLIWALDKKIISGAGLDVLEGENLIHEEKELLYEKENFEKLKNFIENHEIISRENVLFTPHIAFYTKEALHRIAENTAQDILNYTKGKLKERSLIV